MLCDIIENAKKEKEQLLAQGRLEGELKGRLEGELKGELKGELRNKKETARKLITRNLPIEDILDITGLSREQIAEVQYQ